MDWKDIAVGGSALVQLALVITLLLRVAPMWKEIRLKQASDAKEIRIKELEVRALETKTDEVLAGAIGGLASSIVVLGQSGTQMAGLLKDIAIEQRRATETIKILQRANSDSTDELTRNVMILTDRVDRIEERHDKQQRIDA